LGLTDAQFFALTPRQYHLLLDQQREKEKREEWRAGVLASVFVNWSMGRPETPVKPSDFNLPLLQIMSEAPKRARINRAKVAAHIRAQFAVAIAAQKRREPRPPR
jgi:hypothetical protein